MEWPGRRGRRPGRFAFVVIDANMIEAQSAKRSPFGFERKDGKAPGTVVFHFTGPFTAREMYASLPPIGLQNLLDFQSIPDEKQPS